MASKEILGRNILDLIEENKINIQSEEAIENLPVSKIRPNPNQPRVVFKKQSMDELADSIRHHGVVQPIIVKRDSDGFTLVAGERRLRACKMIGQTTIPAIIRDYNSIYMAELALLENLQREDLTVIEEAVAYERVIKKLGLKHDELANKIGKSRSYVTNMLGLLSLPVSIIEDLNEGLLSMGHARVLSKIDDEELVMLIANKIKRESLNVRQTEALVRRKKQTQDETYKHRSLEKAKEEYFLKKRFEGAIKSVFNEHAPEVTMGEKNIQLKFKSNKEMREALEKMKG
ncbi:MAG: ParB/RepB/Spo0J family partition protein [Candidatus Izemoplasmataceae bacterium]